ncbi:MAG: FAD-dependent oxidoreductase [Tepidisphaeraceae bacterium]
MARKRDTIECRIGVFTRWVTVALAVLWLHAGSGLAETVLTADVCIYGGTSGGVVAAVQAARSGKSAIILEPGRHLGGMSASGLSWTDVGSADRIWVLGGIAREFYRRVGKHYGQQPDAVFESPTTRDATRTGYDFPKPPSLSFEPKVAEAVFNEMATEAKVACHFQSPLRSIVKEKNRITEITSENGLRIRAQMFIDASYEGDLMAMADVSFTCGREANAQYGETHNGVQAPVSNPRAGKFDVPVDPYVKPGLPSSGLLPYMVQAGELGLIGSADDLIQSYNYRVCLTDIPANRIPIRPPSTYESANFDLLARWIEARQAAGKKLTLRDFLKYDPLQNGKYDFNNRWAISTDFIGGAHRYPTASAAERVTIARAHEDYLRGLFHFLASDSRVPQGVRDEMGRFGLCRDEFTDNGGWPHQLYVREARRMVSDFVMTEHHCTGGRAAPDPIGFGAYGMDIHAVRRIAHEGQAVNEGTRSPAVPAPYPIEYGAVTPKAAECENLLVPFALSASHVAFGSIRMEPTFMILSQSAATAACMAIDGKVPVQRVNYASLVQKLKTDGQVLER